MTFCFAALLNRSRAASPIGRLTGDTVAKIAFALLIKNSALAAHKMLAAASRCLFIDAGIPEIAGAGTLLVSVKRDAFSRGEMLAIG